MNTSEIRALLDQYDEAATLQAAAAGFLHQIRTGTFPQQNTLFASQISELRQKYELQRAKAIATMNECSTKFNNLINQ
jgi:hypothetical protein